jgi:DNA-binding SARP family transcriptional activator/predicted ATPase/tetratricopeptide (TPR) repeat protein
VALLSVSLLGPFEVTLAGQPVTRFESNKVRALLAYLALEADRPHRREVLAALLWPEWPERAARTYLRNALSDLRAAIGDQQAAPPYLLVSRTTIQFNLASDCRVDVQAFHALVEGDRENAPIDQRLEEALALYRGSFLEGFSLRDSPAFEDWALVTRERLERQASAAMQRLIVAYMERGECDLARAHARRRVGLEPWNEDAHRQLMRTLALCGQRSAALAQYEACRRALREELDVEPGPETMRLYEQIRDGTLAAQREGIREQAEVQPRRHNLPASLAPLIGRRSELTQLRDRLLDPACRLIALSGPGGSGKTRLALEVAQEQVDRYADGVYFIGLAGVGAVEAIAPTVAEAIGCSLYGGRDPRQQLLAHLRGKEMLLVLDNVEHLRGTAGLAIDVLETAPGVQIVVTSRTSLDVQAECLFPVSGMELPPDLPETPVAALQYSAVQLFVSYAHRARPEFELTPDNLAHVVRICRLVAGMPLAILLAAAWMQTLIPAEIAGQLSAEMGQGLDLLETSWRDVPARQRSMRAVFDYSWRLLTGRERLVLQALSVFRGGFTWGAAREVARAGLADLRSLIGKSLLQRTPAGRFEMHELLRQFAVEKLCFSSAVDASAVDAAGDEEQGAAARGRECIALPGRYCVARGAQHCAAVHDRHCAYYAEYLYQRETDVFKGHVHEIMGEIDNIRTAWRWAARHGKAEEILKSSISLWLVYNSAGWVHEGAETFGRAAESLRREDAGGSTETGGVALGLALAIQSFFSYYSGEADRVAELVQEGMSILDKYGPRRELALGMIFAVYGVPDGDPRVQRYLRDSLVVSQDSNFYLGTVLALRMLGRSEEAIEISRAANDLRGTALALRSLGNEAYARGQYVKARQFYEEGLPLFRKVGIQRHIGSSLLGLGDVALALGEVEEARARYQEALDQFKRINAALEAAAALGGLGKVALAHNDPTTAAGYYRQALGSVVESHAGLVLQEDALKLDLIAGMAALLAPTDGERAVELATLAQCHPSSAQETQDRALHLLDRLRAEMSSGVYSAAEERGRSRDIEATLAELLARF